MGWSLLFFLSVVALGSVSWTHPFLRAVSLPPGKSKPSHIVIGSDLGYFRLPKNQLRFFPPADSIPLEVWIQRGSKCEKSRVQYRLPKAPEYTSPFQVDGKFSVPFFLLNAKFGEKSYVTVLNRLGQMVWSHAATERGPSGDPRTKTLIVKPLGKNQLGILRQYEQSYFEIVDWYGNQILNLDPRSAPVPFSFHHDFSVEGSTLITLGNSTAYYSKWWKLFKKKDSFLGSPLIQVDMNQRSYTVLWDYVREHSPFLEPDWTFTARDSGLFWAAWGFPAVENNFVHINSLFHQEGEGWLLSARSLNKLFFWDEKNKIIRWTAGPSPANDYHTQGLPSEFFRQHHATMLPNGNILLFDNKGGKSRVLELRRNGERGTMDLVREFRPYPPLASPRHGSAYSLNNGNIIAYFPNNSAEAGKDAIIEFSGVTGRELARMELDLGSGGYGFRAIPLYEFGGLEAVEKPPC